MDSQAKNIWASVLAGAGEFIQPELSDRWFGMIEPVSLEGGVLVLSVPSPFAKEMIEKKISEPMSAWLKERSLADGVILRVDEGSLPELPPVAPERSRTIEAAERSNLNPKYVFSSFVVGKSNTLSHAASVTVSERPGERYNPLFIWGGVGLGKTHLMHAIGHKILQTRENAKVLYVSSERFTNDMIQSIRDYSSRPAATAEFRDKYRNLDVLLIDDIQFIGGKPETQEAFFNTFNALYDSGRQIVISSDRPPTEIKDVEERLISRFQQGLVTDIQLPNLETRIAILQKKAELKGYQVPEDVILFIAENIPSNIRELEGALNRVVMNASVYNEPMNSGNIALWIKDIIRTGSKGNMSIDTIQQLTAESYGVTVDDLIGDKRTKDLVMARQIAMYLCRDMLDDSLKVIGSAFSGRDHSTVLHACRKVEEAIKSDTKIKLIVDNLKTKM